MATLKIYTSTGYEYHPEQSNKRGSRDSQIKDLFNKNIRLGVRTQRRNVEIFFWFRARESQKARRDQFYAHYTTRDSSNVLTSLINDLEQRVRSEWGYLIDDRHDLYQAIRNNRYADPASSTDKKMLEYLAERRHSPTVGVSDETAALGLLMSVQQQEAFDSAAIAEGTPEPADDWDILISPDSKRQSGITPLGSTADQWEQAKDAVRQQAIESELQSIRESVQRLSTEHGLSNSQIRNRVQQTVPQLADSTSDRRISLPETDADTDSILHQVVPVVLVVLLIGGIGATYALGIGPFAGIDLFTDSDEYDFEVVQADDEVELLVEFDSTENDSVSGNITIVHHGNGTAAATSFVSEENGGDPVIFDTLEPGQYRVESEDGIDINSIAVNGELANRTMSVESEITVNATVREGYETTLTVIAQNDTGAEIINERVELESGDNTRQFSEEGSLAEEEGNVTVTAEGDRRIIESVDISS